MKTITNLIALAVLTAAGACAGTITVTFDQADQTGVPGDTLHFFGIIANTSADTTLADAYYLNSDSYNVTLSTPSYEWIDNFGGTPTFLIGGQSSADIDLFDITLNDPTSDPLALYQNTYTLVGGQDGGDGSGQDNIAQADFSIDLVPEPATLPLLLIGLASIGCCARRRRTSPRTGR